MTIRTTAQPTPGRFLFYIGSESRPGREHTVQFIRCNGQCAWHCTCEDFTFRRIFRRSHRFCKHIRTVVELAKAAGGVSRLPQAIASFAAQPMQSVDAQATAAD